MRLGECHAISHPKFDWRSRHAAQNPKGGPAERFRTVIPTAIVPTIRATTSASTTRICVASPDWVPELDGAGVATGVPSGRAVSRAALDGCGVTPGPVVGDSVAGAPPAGVQLAAYRIVQEALTNIVKHAEATRVSILLVRKATTATVVIEDDGRGFDTEDVRAEGLGLVGMRERIELHEGRLTVESTPTSGTTLVAEVSL